MPGSVPDALHILSHFVFKAALQSSHQYTHFTDQKSEMQEWASNSCKACDLNGEQLKGQAPGVRSIVWTGCVIS